MSVLYTVYPRAYGGTRSVASGMDSTCGLSPRVRGNLWLEIVVYSPVRSIPARTGEPIVVLLRVIRPWVYPRAYGGTVHVKITIRGPRGLSPRVRGNLPAARRNLLPQRSIPARTGEPPDDPGMSVLYTVYPRAYGEPPDDPGMSVLYTVYPRAYGGTAYSTRTPSRNAGLSPRVRGNR